MADNKQELSKIHLEGFGTPEDSRLKGYNGTVTHPTLPLERSYCSKCGAPYGWVSTESSALIAANVVIVYCEKCEDEMNKKIGPIPFKIIGGKEVREIPDPTQKG